jgi:hypothetical protein
MRHRFPNRQRRGAAGWASILAVVLATTWSASVAWAESADEEELPLDTKLFRQLMKDLGLLRDGSEIEYRERAPLVVPPSRNLPQPRSETAATDNPAWPNDPDVKQRKLEAANAKRSRTSRSAAETMDAEARPLPRSELDRGGRVATGRSGGSNTPEDGARPMRPSDLGSKGLFGSLFSLGSKTETSTFGGEPVRESLTAPPAGYQTPSPNHPYGLGPANEQVKPATIEDRAVGQPR